MKKHFGLYYKEDDLVHHGIIGQKWGVRHYQNRDGSLTPEGKLRYATKAINKHRKEYDGNPKKYKRLNIRNSYYTLQRFFGDPENKDHWIFDYAADLQQQIIDPVHEIMYNPKISNKIFSKYKSKGYSAIGDPEDYLYGYDYPMIMIDPANTMKLSSSKRVN